MAQRLTVEENRVMSAALLDLEALVAKARKNVESLGVPEAERERLMDFLLETLSLTANAKRFKRVARTAS